MISATNEVADAVSGSRTGDRGERREPRIERLQADEHAADEDDRAARHDRADDRDRFRERRSEHRDERKRRMLGEKRDQRLQMRFDDVAGR